jgi:hypothetical protein
MNRKKAIIGPGAMGTLSILPIEISLSIPQKIPLHFIGLGGGGTNILTHFLQNGVTGKFTYISCTERSDLKKAGVDFVPFKSPNYQYNHEEFMKYYNDLSFPYEVKENLNKNDRYVLLAGIGGFTGTKLMDDLLGHLTGIQHFAICTLPFGFEVPIGQIVGKMFYDKYQGNKSVKFFDLSPFGKANGTLKMAEAFRKCHEQLFILYKSHSLPDLV